MWGLKVSIDFFFFCFFFVVIVSFVVFGFCFVLGGMALDGRLSGFSVEGLSSG